MRKKIAAALAVMVVASACLTACSKADMDAATGETATAETATGETAAIEYRTCSVLQRKGRKHFSGRYDLPHKGV